MPGPPSPSDEEVSWTSWCCITPFPCAVEKQDPGMGSAPGHLVWLLDCCLVTQVASDGVCSTLGMHQDNSEVPSTSQEGF